MHQVDNQSWNLGRFGTASEAASIYLNPVMGKNLYYSVEIILW